MRLFPARFTSTSIQKLLDYYSQYNPTPMSIKQFIDFGKYLQLFKQIVYWNKNDRKHAMFSGHIIGKCNSMPCKHTMNVVTNILAMNNFVNTTQYEVSLAKGERPPKNW